ncbi:hypothetical protein BCD67_03215 [Oscillatoriales cyanobacterium USR001]|nr:hypothetical protein BCD67_03215 [Oscillatoriales cyanobacterium USR001]
MFAANNDEGKINQIAESVTVQVNSQTDDGSGVIIAKNGDVYTVATNNHVVCYGGDPANCSNSNIKYTIRTYENKDYPVISINRLQKTKNEPDLAIITFKSQTIYPVAPIGNSDLIKRTFMIHVSGFPQTEKHSGPQRELALTTGHIIGYSRDASDGYTLRYDATTLKGMSGGPVFDHQGRLIAIHGQGGQQPLEIVDREGFTLESSAKSGLNAGIPINTLMAMRSQVGQLLANIQIDNTPPISDFSLERPNTPESYYIRAMVRLDNQNLSGSLADLKTVLQSQPSNAEAYFYSGFIKAQQGDQQGAIADYSKAIQLDKSLAAAYNNRGLIYYKLEEMSKAIDDFNEALRLEPRRANTLFNRGQSYYRLRQYQQAITDHTQAIQIRPDFAKAYAQRGAAYYRIGNRDKAMEDFQQAARLFQAQGKTAEYQKVLQLMKDIR